MIGKVASDLGSIVNVSEKSALIGKVILLSLDIRFSLKISLSTLHRYLCRDTRPIFPYVEIGLPGNLHVQKIKLLVCKLSVLSDLRKETSAPVPIRK